MSVLTGIQAQRVYLAKRCGECGSELIPDDYPQENGPTEIVVTSTCENCEQRYAVTYTLEKVEDITE